MEKIHAYILKVTFYGKKLVFYETRMKRKISQKESVKFTPPAETNKIEVNVIPQNINVFVYKTGKPIPKTKPGETQVVIGVT